jgi:hypothetical protein
VMRADGVPPYAARVFRLTWQGNDFLEAVQQPTARRGPSDSSTRRIVAASSPFNNCFVYLRVISGSLCRRVCCTLASGRPASVSHWPVQWRRS